jgi:hypothetical protein
VDKDLFIVVLSLKEKRSLRSNIKENEECKSYY